MQWTGNPAVHMAFESAAYLTAGLLYAVLRARRGDTIGDANRAWVIAGAALGASVGTRLLFWLCDPQLTLAHINDLSYLFGGKTIVGGLLGGLIGVELTKKVIGVTRSTGDLFVFPMIAAMCIGRIGCFLAGPADHTAGKPTDLPWGIAIADGVRRHPVALYEIAFLLALVPFLRRVMRGLPEPPPRGGRSGRPTLAGSEGDTFRIFMVSYLGFRFAVDFLKPDPPPIVLGLTAIQWACLAGLAYYSTVFLKRTRAHDQRDQAVPVL